MDVKYDANVKSYSSSKYEKYGTQSVYAIPVIWLARSFRYGDRGPQTLA